MRPAAVLEQAIATIAPGWGASRARARLRRQYYNTLSDRGDRILGMRRYEGASVGQRTEHWRAPFTSANVEVGMSLDNLRARSRQLVRDNMWAGKGVRVIATRTIGTGIRARIRAQRPADETRLQGAWEDWAVQSFQCNLENQCNFYGLQALAMRGVPEAGEILVRRMRRRSRENLTVPLQLQLLESDHLDTGKTQALPGGNKIVQGIEYDAAGKRAAYWLFPDHPGDLLSLPRSFTSERVPAADVIHLGRVERIGQVRYVPWTSTILVRTRDWDTYEDAQLQRQLVAACFSAFVKDSTMDSPFTAPAPASGQTFESSELEPGLITHLPDGKDIVFAQPPTAEGYPDYSRISLQAIAAGIGVTYEALSGDLKGVSFSGGRIGQLEFHAEVDQWRWLMFIPGFCHRVWSWFREAAVLRGIPGAEDARVTWTAPARELLDPRTEVAAMLTKVRSGFMSLSEGIRQLGRDPREVFEEMRQERELLDEFGLELLSIIRQQAGTGSPPTS